MPKHIVQNRAADDRAERFSSTDPDIRDAVDQEIWQMKQRMRIEEIDIRLGCAPKRVKEALKRIEKRRSGPKGQTSGTDKLESWQIESMLDIQKTQWREQPSGRKLPMVEAIRDNIESPPPRVRQKAESKLIVRFRPKNRDLPAKQHQPRKDETLLRRIVRRVAAERAASPEKAVLRQDTIVTITSEAERRDAKSLIETILHNAKLEFNVTEEQIRTQDEKDFRARAYRLAILLVLEYQGVRPELAAEAIGRTELDARKLLISAKAEVHDIRRPVFYYAQSLAERLGISFDALRKKMK